MTYCEKLIEVIEKEPKVAQVPSVKERLNLLKEVVEDYQIHLSYSSDEDTRKGHKTAHKILIDFEPPPYPLATPFQVINQYNTK